MRERKYVVQKVVELMDQIGDMQAELSPANEQGILAKALVVDHLMWVLELGDPKLPGAALVREEHAAFQKEDALLAQRAEIDRQLNKGRESDCG